MIRFSDYSKHVYAYDATGKKLRAEYHTPIQPYKYNGKELDRHHGLDWYDYGARWYNGISWMNPDPLAEKYYDTSPYVYCADNPIKYIDPNGREKKEYLNYKDLEKSDYSLYPENTPGVLNIWAHGAYSQKYEEYAWGMSLGTYSVDDASSFKTHILDNSSEWQKSGGQNIIIVLHSCGTSDFARKLSNDKLFKGRNITFVAPNAKLKTTTYRSGRKVTRINTKVYYNINSWKKIGTEKGKWLSYKDGELVKTEPADGQPGMVSQRRK